MEYSAFCAFDHALNGPFDNPHFLSGSQPPELSVWRVTAVISVSTVFDSINQSASFCQEFFRKIRKIPLAIISCGHRHFIQEAISVV
jgi:hypothetical protein